MHQGYHIFSRRVPYLFKSGSLYIVIMAQKKHVKLKCTHFLNYVHEEAYTPKAASRLAIKKSPRGSYESLVDFIML